MIHIPAVFIGTDSSYILITHDTILPLASLLFVRHISVEKKSDIYVLYLRDKRESVETDVHTSASGVQKQNLYSLIQLLLIWNNVSYTNNFLQLNTKEIE